MKNKKTNGHRTIRIKGARQNNLKNLNLEIPLNHIIVVTGVSGSGKSSLAFDTLYAEGQRRYVETFSPYARQFMERMDRPLVDRIDNIPPAIAIDRKDPVRTSRSTVGTMTEITDYVKLLFARLGRLHCRNCGRPVFPEDPEYIWNRLQSVREGTEMLITFPAMAADTIPDTVRQSLEQMGFTRLYRAGHIEPLDSWQPAKAEKEIHVVADRLLFRSRDRKRILDSLEQAFRFGNGRLDLRIGQDKHLAFSNRLECAPCRISYRPPIPNLFSFNSPVGACETCRGFGRNIDIDLDLIIPDPSLSLEQGAVKPWGSREDGRMEFHDLMAFCRQQGIPVKAPFKRLSKTQQAAVIEGTASYYGIRGFFEWLETKTYKMHVRVYLSRYRSYRICPACRGTRFKEEALLYRIEGQHIGQIYALSVDQADAFFQALNIPEADKAGRMILDEVRHRLRYLHDVGLGYLTLDRQSRTLSGGEVQRVALTSALGSSLVNALYVLDEPSVGLHPRDSHRLVRILKGLRDIQNTVVVVEHDPEIIGRSDFMIDMGPRAGEEGGEIMYSGPTKGVKNSLTGQYLNGEKHVPVPETRRRPKKGHWLVVVGAAEHNLRDITVEIPLGLFVCLTGVSGSGKSTLAEDILYRGIKRARGDAEGLPGRYKKMRGMASINDVVLVDQRAIGRTPRANLLTYAKAMDPIRHLFAGTDEARRMGYGPGFFSFNVAGGRCETCQGAGFEKVEMQFLSDVFITCPDCKGKRFKKAVLDIRYQGKNIADVLSMTVHEAFLFFGDQPRLKEALTALLDVGMGYMRLGQPINTLSGGEAQRLKLSSHLRAGDSKNRLFIFDEPTTGLHFEDIQLLLSALQKLVDMGNTILIIEHNMDVVKTADWVIDLGPEGGDEGGEVVVAGPPEAVSGHGSSHTARFLRKYLSQKGHLKMPKSLSRPDHITPSPSPGKIDVRGAREHNLKDLSLTIPRQQFVVVTGVSGSGKSTLIFDILFAEGQRLYLESLAPYVRQYVKILERPEVDAVSGLPPTVAIQQRISHASHRSTVATLTEIYHFLRLLYSKLGTRHCPGCGRKLTAMTHEDILTEIKGRYRGKQAALLAPKVSGRKGFHKDTLNHALRRGYKEARIDGAITLLEKGMALSRFHEHTIEILIGRLPGPDLDRLVRQALEEGKGSLLVLDSQGQEEIFSRRGICPACGIGLRELDPRLFSFNSKQGACTRCDGLGVVHRGMSDQVFPCPRCGGSRLSPEALSVTVKGYPIWDLVQRPASRLLDILKDFTFAGDERPIAKPIMDEILARLSFLNRLGLSYLSLSRSGDTLSGGEAQRIRLAAQLGSNLTGVCYILDEPTIGLHARDNGMLLKALLSLKTRGNSILVVEHDEETIRRADHIIDLGPGAGLGGGKLVAAGKLSDLKKAPASITGATFNGRPHEVTSRLRAYGEKPILKIVGASENNLKGIDVSFPLGTLICVTGVSGSGKSTLLKETLYKGLWNRLLKKDGPAGQCRTMAGWEGLERVL